jgi:hypothetical protein
LRLAAKCFEKAGEIKKRDHALAYLAFVEMEEQENSGLIRRRRAKQGDEYKRRFYDIATQLLQAQDIDFLGKAGLCLMKTGPAEYARSAQIFEIYACIHYARRHAKKGHHDRKPSHHEQQYFIYAAKLFERCSVRKEMDNAARSEFIVNAVRCFVSSGSGDGLNQAAALIENNCERCKTVFMQLVLLWQETEVGSSSPLDYWRSQVDSGSSDVLKIQSSMTKLARIACRYFHLSNNESGLATAIEVIPSQVEKIQVLAALEDDADRFVSSTIWGAFNPAFSVSDERVRAAMRGKKPTVDATKLLVDQFLIDGKRDRAADILEDRGRLLEAAACLSKEPKYMARAFGLQCQHVELVLGCSKRDQRRQGRELSEILGSLILSFDEVKDALAPDVELSFSVSRARIERQATCRAVELCMLAQSALWKYQGAQLAIETKGMPNVVSELFEDKGIWPNQLFCDLRALAEALNETPLRRQTEEVNMVSRAESYFQLYPRAFDLSLLSTKTVTNQRLRLALQQMKENLPTSSTFVTSNSLTVSIDREKTHSILARYVCNIGFNLLAEVQKSLSEKASRHEVCRYLLSGLTCNCKNTRHSIEENISTSRYASHLQAQIICLEEEKDFCALGRRIDPNTMSLWDERFKKAVKILNSVSRSLAQHIYISSYITGVKISVEEGTYKSKSTSIVIRRGAVLSSLFKTAQESWRIIPRRAKQTDLIETMRLWRILDICKEDEHSPAEDLERNMKRLERVEDAQKYWKHNAMDQFIRTKIVDGEVKSVELLFRCWIWAVESAKENLLNSITLVERLLKNTRDKPGLVTLPKLEQLDLLELNLVGLFSLLSLRYSEAPASKIWIAIPEKLYLQRHLCSYGEDYNRGHGFGIFLEQALQNTLDRSDNFFRFFDKFVVHLENLADMILRSRILFIPSATVSNQKHVGLEETLAVERAVILSSCLLCNAVAISRAGKVMTRKEASDETNALPRLPLCGSLRNLGMKLRDALLGLKDTNVSLRLNELCQSLNESSSFRDLFKITCGILQNFQKDRMVQLRVHQGDKIGSIEIDVLDEIESFISSVGTVSFGRLDDTFNRDPAPCQEFLPNLHYEQYGSDEQAQEDQGISSEDIRAYSRKSVERNAAPTIQRCFREWRRRTAQLSTLSYFQKWKGTMARFVYLVAKDIAEKRSKTVPLLDTATTSGAESEHRQPNFPLQSFPNLWNDLDSMRRSTEKWKGQLEYAASLVIDDVECELCGVWLDEHTYNSRRLWWQTTLRSLQYRVAAQQYNQQFLPHHLRQQQSFNYYRHLQSEQHVGFEKYFEWLIEEYTKVTARFDISLFMLGKLMYVCEQEADRGGPHTSWYLNLREEAASRQVEFGVETILQQILGMFSERRYPALEQMLGGLIQKSFEIQAYFATKRNEEKANLEMWSTAAIEDHCNDIVEAEDESDLVLAFASGTFNL